MEMNINIMDFVVSQALILIPALYVVGMIPKNSQIPDKFIPLILLGLGIIGPIALLGFNIQAIIQGILVTGATVLTNQLIKRSKKE